jgi:hypothetical protein
MLHKSRKGALNDFMIHLLDEQKDQNTKDYKTSSRLDMRMKNGEVFHRCDCE